MTDMHAAFRNLSAQRDAIVADVQSDRSEVLLFDENLREMGFVNDYLSLKFDASVDGTGALTSTAPVTTPHAPQLILRDPNRPLFVTAQTASYRWSGVVSSSEPRRSSGAATVIDIVGAPLLTRLDYVSLWKNPRRPLENQPKLAPVKAGNAVTVVKELAAANIARMQSNPSWPIHVVPNYLNADDSPYVVIESDMQPMGKTFLEALEGTGVVLKMWIWVPGDRTVPGGENFDRPTMVLDVVDMGSRSGWSADVDDPITQYYRVLSGGGFVAEWMPEPTPAPAPAYEDGYPGTVNAAPWIDWDLDGPGIESWSMPTVYATCPKVIWTGLRRGWLAEIITSIAKETTTKGDPPILYDAVTDVDRQALMGALGSSELVITGTNGEDLAASLFESRGYRYLTVAVINGAPFIFGYHFGLGDAQAFSSSLMGRFVASVTRASFEDSPSVRCRWDLTVGDGKNDDPPSIVLMRRLRRNFELLKKRYYTDTKSVSTPASEEEDDDDE